MFATTLYMVMTKFGYSNKISGMYSCCGSILSLVQILLSFVFGYGNV